MGGTVHGRIDCSFRENVVAATPTFWAEVWQAQFKTTFDFLSAHPAFTRIAWYKGDSGGNIPGGATRGSDYWDGAAPFGMRAFAVFKVAGTAHPWYLMIQWEDMQQVASNAAPTTVAAQFWGGNLATNVGFGMSMAWAIDSGGLDYTTGGGPWNGTLLNNGNDTKGTPVWVAPSGGQVHVLPRINSQPDGAFTTNKDALCSINNPVYEFTAIPAGAMRGHMYADSDTFMYVFDYNDDGGGTLGYAGIYIPRPGITVTRPFVMLFQNTDFPLALWTTQFGPKTGTNMTNDGGIALPDGFMNASNSCKMFSLERLANVGQNANYGPNHVFSPAQYDEWPIPLIANDVPLSGISGPQTIGYLGTLDPSMVREIYNTGWYDTNTGLTRVFIGPNSTASIKYSFPWNGTQTPRTNTTRAGVSF